MHPTSFDIVLIQCHEHHRRASIQCPCLQVALHLAEKLVELYTAGSHIPGTPHLIQSHPRATSDARYETELHDTIIIGIVQVITKTLHPRLTTLIIYQPNANPNPDSVAYSNSTANANPNPDKG